MGCVCPEQTPVSPFQAGAQLELLDGSLRRWSHLGPEAGGFGKEGAVNVPGEAGPGCWTRMDTATQCQHRNAFSKLFHFIFKANVVSQALHGTYLH